MANPVTDQVRIVFGVSPAEAEALRVRCEKMKLTLAGLCRQGLALPPPRGRGRPSKMFTCACGKDFTTGKLMDHMRKCKAARKERAEAEK